MDISMNELESTGRRPEHLTEFHDQRYTMQSVGQNQISETDKDQALRTTSHVITINESTSDIACPETGSRSFAFWAIMLSLAMSALLTSLEGTIVVSTLPTITNELGGGNLYVWVPNAYFLSYVATLPFYAQISDIFGRRAPMLAAVLLFIFGSGLCGGSSSMGMLIVGRAVQGLGGGGMSLLFETIICDLVPLRERSFYVALGGIVATVGAITGPLIGGAILTRSTWRWIFYLNLPTGGLVFSLLFAFLRLKYERDQSWKQRLKRVDVIGNLIFIASIGSVLIALTWAGTVYEWNQYQIVTPLVIGFLGLGAFLLYEWLWCNKPSFPREVLSNRTSAAAFFLTILHSAVGYWSFYFLPVYFQAVQSSTPFQAALQTMPIFAAYLPSAMVGGAALAKWGR